jgi:hypothetical protein
MKRNHRRPATAEGDEGMIGSTPYHAKIMPCRYGGPTVPWPPPTIRDVHPRLQLPRTGDAKSGCLNSKSRGNPRQMPPAVRSSDGRREMIRTGSADGEVELHISMDIILKLFPEIGMGQCIRSMAQHRSDRSPPCARSMRRLYSTSAVQYSTQYMYYPLPGLILPCLLVSTCGKR